MGANSSKVMGNLLEGYTYSCVKDDAAYGEVQVYQKKGYPEQLGVTRLAMHENVDIQKKLKLIKDKCYNQHPNITRILDCQSSSSSDLCSDINLIHVGIEYLEKSLKTDMESRRQIRMVYNESEIWYIVQTVANTLRYINYTDIHPINLRLTNEGHIKLLDTNVIANQVSNLAKVQCGWRELDYLAPEQLYILKNRVQDPNQEYQQEKMNLFSLGVISLCCLTALDVSKYYDIDSCTFNYELAQQRLNTHIHDKNYSESLKHLLWDLLNQNTHYRPTYAELLDKLDKVDTNKIALHLYANQTQFSLKASQITISQQSNLQVVDKLENQDFNIFHAKTPLTSRDKETPTESQDPQVSLDKLKQLKVRFQALKGESTTPIKTEIQQPQFVFQYNQPNFQEMDPIIQKALAKSRDVLQKCHPMSDPHLIPVTAITNLQMQPHPSPINTPVQTNRRYPSPVHQTIPITANSVNSSIPFNINVPSTPIKNNNISPQHSNYPQSQQQYYQQPPRNAQSQPQQFVQQRNIEQLLQQAEIEIQKSNQISQRYFNHVA